MLKAWKESMGGAGGELTPEDLRRVLVKQGSKMGVLVGIQICEPPWAAVQRRWLGPAARRLAPIRPALNERCLAVACTPRAVLDVGAAYGCLVAGARQRPWPSELLLQAPPAPCSRHACSCRP